MNRTAKAYADKAEAELQILDAKIEELKGRARMGKADAEIKYNQQLEELEAKREDFRHRLRELRESGEGAWRNVRSGVENAWMDLRTAVQRASDQFA